MHGMDDRALFEETRTAMKMIGMPATDQSEVFRTVAAILHIGNIQFQGDAKATVSNADVAKIAARLLQVPEDQLIQVRTRRTRRRRRRGRLTRARNRARPRGLLLRAGSGVRPRGCREPQRRHGMAVPARMCWFGWSGPAWTARFRGDMSDTGPRSRVPISQALTNKTIDVNRENVTSPLDKAGACFARDSLAKSM